MKRTQSQDNLVAIAAGAIVVLLTIALIANWLYLNSSQASRPVVAFATFGPMTIQTRGYSIRTTLAIQIQPKSSEWAAKNHAKLDQVFQKALAETDPAPLRTGEGLRALQVALKDAGNQALNTGNLEAVILTDIMVVQDDEN